ncbi:ABC transporter ATP-binding protein/permease [Castellaniella caeni]|uniref:ABC transporter ATP-binding protein/permease n=1 Tax=Castellaniella caeni TaxID=266123 RepID=UPI00083168D2|nr:ABC transporter ATP-binding protein/permease [Castellaniella caeni]
MEWQKTLIESGVWIAKAYVLTVLAGAFAIWALQKYTRWGHQFWRLSAAFFAPRRNWRPLAGVALILLLTLAAVRVDVLFSNWYNTMYSALQALNEPGFWAAMLLFALLAAVHVVRSLIDFYVQQAFVVHWREWLNERLLQNWMDQQAYYRSQSLSHLADNPDQRIQQDITSFANNSMTLAVGLINALVSTIAFTVILWNLSGPMTVLGHEIPRAMVFLVFIYVFLATLLAIWIGKPLIRLNFLNEKLNADYRYALVRVREYAESIAFYRGERVEGRTLRYWFAEVIGNAWDIIYRSLKFLGFNFVVTQTAVVFPFIIQAARFFSKQISLGDLIQTAQAFGQLQTNLSFFRNVYDSFASYRATLDRLTGFDETVAQARAMKLPHTRQEGSRLALNDVTVCRPDGHALLKDLTLEVAPEQPVLVRGPSGAGKTTLLRMIAGIWPYGSGEIIRPGASSLFLAQKPYLPLGTLREALHYPQPVEQVAAGQDEAILTLVQLGHLHDKLDTQDDWSRILSLGEQQRLAFGRLLIARPDAAFLDEATSAMDEGLEDAMYRLLREQLPGTRLVSVGHRSTLRRHHGAELILQGEGGGWQLKPI